MEFFEVIVTPLVSAAIGAVVAAIVSRVKTAASENRAEDAAMREGMLALLRNQLTRAHTAHVVNGEPLYLYERENIARIHQAYKDLDGNDIGDQQYAELCTLPVAPSEQVTPRG